jgi:hypothetical protein
VRESGYEGDEEERRKGDGEGEGKGEDSFMDVDHDVSFREGVSWGRKVRATALSSIMFPLLTACVRESSRPNRHTVPEY